MKVYKSEKISKIKADYVIVLAWRFSDMIIKKIKKLSSNKKLKIVIPCPKFKILKL